MTRLCTLHKFESKFSTLATRPQSTHFLHSLHISTAIRSLLQQLFPPSVRTNSKAAIAISCMRFSATIRQSAHGVSTAIKICVFSSCFLVCCPFASQTLAKTQNGSYFLPFPTERTRIAPMRVQRLSAFLLHAKKPPTAAKRTPLGAFFTFFGYCTR